MAQDILVYTFKNFPYKDQLPFKEVVILDKLKKDLEAFCQRIRIEKPTRIFGFAKACDKISFVETFAINQFNGFKKVLNVPILSLKLTVPSNLKNCFVLRKKPTDSFCNYSMFKIQYFLNKFSLKIPFTFVHIAERDLDKLTIF